MKPHENPSPKSPHPLWFAIAAALSLFAVAGLASAGELLHDRGGATSGGNGPGEAYECVTTSMTVDEAIRRCPLTRKEIDCLKRGQVEVERCF